MFSINDVDVATDGTIYITDTGNNRIRKIDTNGIVTTIAGKDAQTPPNCSDIPATGNATDIYLSRPELLTIGPDSALYVSSFSCASMRRIAGTLSTLLVAGGALGLNQGNGIAFGVDGTIYLSYFYGNGGLLIARSPTDTSTVLLPGSIIAGQPNSSFEFIGDGGPAKDSELSSPTTLAIGPDGSIYVYDTLNYRIRRISPTYTNAITPITGGGVSTVKGDITVVFPSGAVNANTNLTMIQTGWSAYPTHPYHPTRFFFSLNAESDGKPITHFEKPYTLTIKYNDFDFSGVPNYNESLLNIFFWDGIRWQPLLPCQGCSHDTANNQITARADHLTDFALMQMPSALGIYLPLIQQ